VVGRIWRCFAHYLGVWIDVVLVFAMCNRVLTGTSYVLSVTKRAALELIADNCFRNSAALSFYTLFSIAPVIFLAVYVAGLMASDVNFQQQISDQFSQLVGYQAAQGIGVLLDTIETEDQNRFQLTVGITVLIFSATNIFIQIQSSFNDIYKVRSRSGTGFVKQVLDRVISLGIVLSLGFLLIISLVLDSLVLIFHQYVFSILNDAAVIVVQLTQLFVLAALVVAVIYGLFHFLPDVYLPKKYKVRGSVVVASMLLLGKYGISFYIASSNLSELGGASASVILLMLWVYYTSIILFFGAEVIRAMADIDGVTLQPRRYATGIQTIEVADASLNK
tara:strand:- start:130669 stop:131670 length:1002 start_codon:yes stop_codon:yes gene_type:complete